MKTFKPKFKFIAASLLLMFFIGFWFISPHWWLAVSTAQVTYNGKPSLSSRAYRSKHNELIIKVSEPNEFAYLIDLDNRRVSSPNFSNLSFFQFAAFVEHNDQFGVALEDTEKTGIAPQIVANNNFIEFTGLRKHRIRVAW